MILTLFQRRVKRKMNKIWHESYILFSRIPRATEYVAHNILKKQKLKINKFNLLKQSVDGGGLTCYVHSRITSVLNLNAMLLSYIQYNYMICFRCRGFCNKKRQL
jgi:hypothetical protein